MSATGPSASLFFFKKKGQLACRSATSYLCLVEDSTVVVTIRSQLVYRSVSLYVYLVGEEKTKKEKKNLSLVLFIGGIEWLDIKVISKLDETFALDWLLKMWPLSG